MAGVSIEENIRKTAGKSDKAGIYNNAAQVWNHTFFWKSMKPKGGGVPTGKVAELFTASFGSGWVWLVQDCNILKIVKTSNADMPIGNGQTPLISCDVWEHAYYLNYQNRRKDFVQTFLKRLANWEFAASQLK